MRIYVETDEGDFEGVLALKDESFLMVKVDTKVKVIHWDNVCDVKRIIRGERISLDLDVFKKTRE